MRGGSGVSAADGAKLTIQCPHCGYGLVSFAEAVEALEAAGACSMCGGIIPLELLEAAVELWADADLLKEGSERAADEAGLAEEEAWESAGPDFGDDGEEDDDEEN